MVMIDCRRMKEIDRMVNDLVKGIIKRQEKAMKEEGEAIKKDLLGILLEFNQKESNQSQGNHNKNKNVGLIMNEVIDDCKFFYFGGQAITARLLAFTMMLLGKHTDWQACTREEVLQVFEDQKPKFGGLSHLKIRR
ncbi:hypothetical protein QN277_002451 [Acacia crassicarpa]|uniref:Cytochrome P450 n=1 Tax=Acacia crassicarpa TaxID=499986 RepID=A0AAE1N9C0_9FABA|nr:hypothetical protein QN277_002451 [Acacia crassicarpa]